MSGSRQYRELKLHTTEPAWASEVLRLVVEEAVVVSQGALGDLFSALFSVLADYQVELTQSLRNFIKDLSVSHAVGRPTTPLIGIAFAKARLSALAHVNNAHLSHTLRLHRCPRDPVGRTRS